ncbi:MAG: ribonuclease R, partial [Christensenellales bacterium]
IFIPVSGLNGAMHNDTVLVQKNFNSSQNKPDGKVVKILSRGLNIVVGKVVSMTKNFAMVSADNKRTNDITIKLNAGSQNNKFGAKKGDKVVVKLTKFDNKRPEGKIIEVLISDNPVNVDVLSIVREFELYEEFPKEVLVAADRVKDVIDEQDLKNRTDLRNLNTFTIDGEDARDFDDAVSIESLDNGNVLLGVHIADVGEYVPYGSVLDAEAFKRGTSTYFPNAVFPMLPKQLSNEICSLKEGVDRLTLSCLMQINKSGEVVSHKICESVIKSKARMTYAKVQKMLDGDEELCSQYNFLFDDLKKMEKLALKLEKVRANRGCLNFEIPEPKIILNDKLEIERFEKRPNTMADRIIESFMLIANETVAKEFENKHIPFVYRVHEKPNEEKLENFKEFVESLGFKFDGDFKTIDSKKIQKFIDSVPQEKRLTVNKVLLRSMQKAKYSSVCLGHYGLGAQYYCHFTSPIRRYPDLTIHRIIKQSLRKELSAEKIKLLKAFVVKSATQSSERETISDKAEIQVDEYFKARFMSQHIGEIFDGVVSGVTERGIYVELENTCEGFIFVETLPDKF